MYIFRGGKLSYGTKHFTVRSIITAYNGRFTATAVKDLKISFKRDKFLVINNKKVYYKVYRHRKPKDRVLETSYETCMASYDHTKIMHGNGDYL